MTGSQGAGGPPISASVGPRKLPCTILSGFLGSGKTTLLKHILRNKEGLRCAVIVNDMAELNIDASLVKQGALVQAEERLVEITNGCICCTLRDDLAVEVARLAEAGCYDYCVIESTGIGEPMQVAETFALAAGEGGPPLADVATLDTCVTVVDAANLMANFSSLETLRDRGEAADEEDERGVAELLLDQIEFADVILLNKVDLVSADEQRRLLGLLRALNPGADLIPTSHSSVPLSRVINTGRFSFEQAQQNAGWLQSLQERHAPETEEYDISSLVYRARRPFHPGRLHDFLTTHFVLQEPDWSEALAAEAGVEYNHAQCNGHHHGSARGQQQQQQQAQLSSTVQQAVLHASQAAAQAAAALQAVVQQQAAGSGSSSPDQQALLATVAAATSAAAAASSAASMLLSRIQLDGSAAAPQSAVPQAAQQHQQQGHHHDHAQGRGHAQPHQHYRQHGLPVSAAEAASRQARLTAECGQLCRSKGFVWLATRPDLCGEWSQAGGIVRLGVGGPWYAALPDEAWPQDPEARAAIRKDFQEPHGDRRQELVLIGVRLNGKALTAALDACLCSETEMAAAVAGQLADPFLEWPSLQQILDAGDDEEEDSKEEIERASRLSTVDEGEEEAAPVPGSVHDVVYGAAELQEAFDLAAARLAQPGGPAVLGVVSWHAAWCEQCSAAAAALRQLAAAHPAAAFFTLDVEGSAANTAFALEKVMRKPESRRAGAKPVLKSGDKFPCITLHYLPSLQPVQTLAGSDAVNALQAALREHAAAAAPAAAAEDPSPVASTGRLLVLTKGAAEYKGALAAARDAGGPVVVIWTRSEDDGSEVAALRAAATQAGAVKPGLVLVDADAGASPANQVLAGALKVSCPEVHIYQDMKLASKLVGSQATPSALTALLARLGSSNNGGSNGRIRKALVTATAAAAKAVSESAAVGAPTPAPAAPSNSGISSGSGVYDPPGGKFAKPGATKRFPDGRMGYFFPKMPCLRCGCPWWSSEEWDARCLRCGWDCESQGYDNDSQPLPKHRPKWETYTAAIREGRTPAWAGKAAAH